MIQTKVGHHIELGLRSSITSTAFLAMQLCMQGRFKSNIMTHRPVQTFKQLVDLYFLDAIFTKFVKAVSKHTANTECWHEP